MRIDDRTQNLSARIRAVQISVLALLSICVVRLYNLQIVHGDYYHERAINQRLRTLSIPAPRGTILDRHGQVLVDSRPVYDIVLQREKGRQIDVAVRGVNEPGDDYYRPVKDYGNAFAGVLPVTPEDREAVVEAMWSVVNEAGTASRIQKAGYDIAGKTGTAQVVGLGKDVGRNKDHSWFVSYAPAFKPEIAVLALIENSGFGSEHAAPAARALYDVYFEKTARPEQVAAYIEQSERAKASR